MRKYLLPFTLLAAILLLIGVTPILHAQESAGTPLILVIVPGNSGNLLAARLQARLDGTLRGYTVVQRSTPIRSISAAQALGGYYNVPLIVWAAADAPTTVHRTALHHPLAPVEALTDTLTLDTADERALTVFVRATVGQAAALDGQWETALRSLDAALFVASPDWEGLAEVYYYRGLCQMQRGDLQSAWADFSTAAAQNDRWYYQHALAWAHFNLREPRLAVEAISRAVTLAPEQTALYLDRAFFYEQQGDLDAAIADYSAVLAMEPDNAEAYRRRGEAYFNSGNFEAALADDSRLVALLPDDPYALLNRAQAYLALQEYEAALDDLNTALATEPAMPDPFIFQRGLANLYAGDHTTAITDFQDYTALRPEDPAGWINLGQAYENAGSPVGAVDAYTNALNLDPEATYLHTSLARAYYDAIQALQPGPPQRAAWQAQIIAHATQAIDAFPEDTTARLYRALAYLEQNRLENALEDLSAALRTVPDFEAALFNRAIVYTRLGDAALDSGEQRALYRAGIADYATLLQIDFAAYAYLLPYQAYLYVNLGQYSDALDIFATYERALPDAPHDQTYAAYKGRAYLETGQRTEALAAYQAALDGPSDDLRCEANLAAGLVLGGTFEDYPAAAEHVQAYLDQGCTVNPVVTSLLQLYLLTWQ